jgi:hypothetical protein
LAPCAAIAVASLVGCQTEPRDPRPPPASAASPAQAAAPASAPAAAAPAVSAAPAPPSPVDLRARKERELSEAIAMYAQGRYDDAVVWLTPLIGAPELSNAQQLRVLKFLAFSHCASGRLRQCRQYFDMAFDLDPTVQLTDAERGHPVWSKEFNAARAAARNRRGTQRAP